MKSRVLFPSVIGLLLACGVLPESSDAQDPAYEFVKRSDWGATDQKFLPGGVKQLEPIGKVSLLTVHHTHNLPSDLDTEASQVRYLQELHIDGEIAGNPTKYGDIAYHYIIGPSGKVYEGRSVEKRGDSNTRYISEALRATSNYNTSTKWDGANISYSKGSANLWKPGGVNQNLDRLGVPPRPGSIGGHLTIVFLGNFDQPAAGQPSPQPTAAAKKAFVSLAAEILKEKSLTSRQIVMHRECASTNCPGDGIYEWLRGAAVPTASGERNIGPGIKAVEERLTELKR